MVNFFQDPGIPTKFISVIHLANGAEFTNKVILGRIKEKLDYANEPWAEQLHEVLWSYHTTPNSTTKETPFTIVYGVDTMLPVKIHTPT